MTGKSIAGSVVLASTLGIGYGVGRAVPPTPQQEQPPPRPMTQLPVGPAHWVPFKGTATVTELGQSPRLRRFYRRSDGSTRYENFSPDQTQVLVTIHNLSTGLLYVKGPDDQWSSMPSQKDQQPAPTLTYPSAWIAPSTENILGYETYRVKQSGSVAWLAKDLNYFEIRAEYGDKFVRVTEFTSIERIEPEGELFVPPPGAAVKYVSKIDEMTLSRPAQRR